MSYTTEPPYLIASVPYYSYVSEAGSDTEPNVDDKDSGGFPYCKVHPSNYGSVKTLLNLLAVPEQLPLPQRAYPFGLLLLLERLEKWKRRGSQAHVHMNNMKQIKLSKFFTTA